MEPTFTAGSLVLVWCWTKNYQVDNVIAFHHDNKIFIKRVAAINNNQIEVRGDNQLDSLEVGPIDQPLIIGRMIWP